MWFGTLRLRITGADGCAIDNAGAGLLALGRLDGVVVYSRGLSARVSGVARAALEAFGWEGALGVGVGLV